MQLSTSQILPEFPPRSLFGSEDPERKARLGTEPGRKEARMGLGWTSSTQLGLS